MKELTIFLLLLYISNLAGQKVESDTYNITEVSELSAYGTRVVLRKSGKDHIQGDQYYESKNRLASIYVDGKKTRRSYVRYNAMTDEIEVTEVFNILKREDIEIVLDEGYMYKILDFNGTKQFFIFLKEGKISLVMKVEKIIKNGKGIVTGYEQTTPTKYVEKRSYFIKRDGDDLLSIKLKKKDILRALGDKKDEIEKYVTSKKLSYKKESDLIKIISYYNKL
ncbi:hypothetical protein [Aquimarina celericrescens]|uniref:Uncharacterized protein n=1 Tax=Aquimarina celericrescens TaxID=1964542 RepID=A0ABW5AYK1_9FLAO|nr:hypothetical protein [Aquimarina celericrescens]